VLSEPRFRVAGRWYASVGEEVPTIAAAHVAVQPPDTSRMCPFTKLDASLAR